MHTVKAKSWSWIPTLYTAEGLPYFAVLILPLIMYKSLGMGNAEITFYTGWFFLPWVIKPLWSPLVDMIGSKRKWILAMQLFMAIGFGSIALSLETPFAIQLSMCLFWATAFLSATQDIAADGFYMLALDTYRQSLFSGIRTTFYRISSIICQGGLVILAGIMSDMTGDTEFSWAIVMAALSVVFFLFTVYHFFALPFPASDHREKVEKGSREILKEYFLTLGTFFREKKGTLCCGLLFILFYKLPEVQLQRLINPFLMDLKTAGGMGLTETQVGIAYGTIGIIGLLAGGIIGGIIVAKYGLRKCLHPMAWAMSLTCLVFVYLSIFTDSPFWLINVCVFIEQFGYGVGTTAFILYVIYYSEGTSNPTTAYAMATGIMTLGTMLPGMAAGWIQQQIGYLGFFIWTMICCGATIIVCYMVDVPSSFGLKTNKS